MLRRDLFKAMLAVPLAAIATTMTGEAEPSSVGTDALLDGISEAAQERQRHIALRMLQQQRLTAYFAGESGAGDEDLLRSFIAKRVKVLPPD